MSILAFFPLLSFAGESTPLYEIGTNSDTSGGHGCTYNYCTQSNNQQQDECFSRWQADQDEHEPWGTCTLPTFISGSCGTDLNGCTVQTTDGICQYQCFSGTEISGAWMTEEWNWVKAHIPHL